MLTPAQRDAVNAAMDEQRAMGGLVPYADLTSEQRALAEFPARPSAGWWDTPAHRREQARLWLYRVDENGNPRRAALASC